VPAGLLAALRSLPYSSVGGRVSTFVPTAILFLGFSLPLFFFCRDRNATRDKKPIPWRQAFLDLKGTVAETKRYPGSLRFILTSFIYQDAMGTIVTSMALYAIFAMDFQKGAEANVFLVMTIPAVLGSYLIGKLVDRIGAKKTLSLVLLCWVILLTAMIAIPSRTAFWTIGLIIGFIYGGVNTAERPLLLTLIPAAEAGRFFSLMVLSSRAAAVVGPLIFAFTVDGLVPTAGAHVAYRAGVGTIGVAMLIALVMLQKVPDKHRA
jgi:UMF1 family MFS transporter